MQDSLPAAGPALPGGIGYPQGSCERFHGCNDSPFLSFLARCQFIFSGQNDGLTPDFPFFSHMASPGRGTGVDLLLCSSGGTLLRKPPSSSTSTPARDRDFAAPILAGDLQGVGRVRPARARFVPRRTSWGVAAAERAGSDRAQKVVVLAHPAFRGVSWQVSP